MGNKQSKRANQLAIANDVINSNEDLLDQQQTDVFTQLLQFGYDPIDIQNAIEVVRIDTGQLDINEVVDLIEKNRNYVVAKINIEQEHMSDNEQETDMYAECNVCKSSQFNDAIHCYLCGNSLSTNCIVFAKKTSIIMCVSNNISECIRLKRLLHIIRGFDVFMYNIELAVDDYLHLMQKHPTDEANEYIMHQFGDCDIKNCKFFSRVYRDRSTDTEQKNTGMEDIFDKIHVYCAHSYDVGHRLSTTERDTISNMSNIVEEKMTESKQQSCKELFADQAMKAIFQMLKPKHMLYDSLCNSIRISTKYESGMDLKDNEKQMNINMYSFGYLFQYGKDFEHKWVHILKATILVQPKYNDLKQELTSNGMTMEMFRNECKKAGYHLSSQFCKQNFTADPSEYSLKKFTMHLDHIVSLMVYANYDNLQYEFKKTYRYGEGKTHEAFYHLGKNLTISVLRFGIEPRKVGTDEFYHGVGEQLTFPAVIGTLNIYCPVSTTESFEVACNFANHDRGLIAHFGSASLSVSNCFKMDWLSDFPSEKEIFFIQNIGGLIIKNIINAANIISYHRVLAALNVLDETMTNRLSENKDDKDGKTSEMIRNIFENQLFKKSNNEYYNNMCNLYFTNKKKLYLDYAKIKQHCPVIISYLFHPKFEWISIKSIQVLLPNIVDIELFTINLSSFVFEDLYQYILYREKIKAPLNSIELYAKNDAELSCTRVINQFTTLFEKIGFIFFSDLYQKNICLVNSDEDPTLIKWSAAGWFLHAFDKNLYFSDPENKIAEAMDAILNSNFSMEHAKQPLSGLEHLEEKDALNTMLNIGHNEISVDWKQIIMNQDSFIFNTFYSSQHQWINMTILNEHLSHIVSITMKNISLTSYTMEYIIDYLGTKNKSIDRIEIALSDDTIMSKAQAREIYTQTLELIGFRFRWGGDENTIILASIELESD